MDQSTLSHCYSEMDCNITILISKHETEWISLHCVQFWRHLVQKSQSLYAVNNNTFCGDKAKMSYHTKYLRMSWNYLDLLYRFGRRISEDNFPNIRLVVVQGTLLWQPVKYGTCSQTSGGATFTLCFGIRQRIGRSQICFQMFQGNNQATSCSNLVNFHLLISEFTLLKRAIFAAIRPQFDDDLHLSRWRFETDWKITILISAELSAIISVHLIEIWWDSVQWPLSLRHKQLYSQRQKFFWVTSGTFSTVLGC